MTLLRDQLKAGFAGKSPDPLRQSDSAASPGSEAPPSVPELAERIKALKATRTIEATPQRWRMTSQASRTVGSPTAEPLLSIR